MVAAQFSQNQTALQGGELGWVQPNQLDPEVARLVAEMPVGAISNPVKVPGGFSIVTLQGKREIGREVGTVVSLRQVFLPFTSALDPQAPTEQQRQALDKARGISASVHSCEQMEQVAKANNSPRPADPGEVRLEAVNPPAFRQMLASLPFDRASQPLVTADGIAVIIVCSREQKNLAQAEQAGGAGAAAQRARGIAVAPAARRSAPPRHHRPARRRGVTRRCPPLREVIARHGLAARRALGQHFLLDAQPDCSASCARPDRWPGGMWSRSGRGQAG